MAARTGLLAPGVPARALSLPPGHCASTRCATRAWPGRAGPCEPGPSRAQRRPCKRPPRPPPRLTSRSTPPRLPSEAQQCHACGHVRPPALPPCLPAFSTATVATMFILAGAHYSGLRTESVSKKWAREWATRRGPCRAQQPGRAADQVRGAHPCATLAPPLAAFISRLSLHSPVCRRCIVLAHGTDAHLPLPAF